MIDPGVYQVEMNSVADTRPPYSAILFEFEEQIKQNDRIRRAIPSINAFNTFVIWEPATTQINQNPNFPDVLHGYVRGWANDPRTNGNATDLPTQNAPINPANPVWSTIYTALDTEIGIQKWMTYEERPREIQDVTTQRELDFLVQEKGPEIRTDVVPVASAVSTLSPP